MADRNYGVLRTAEKFEAFSSRIIEAGIPFGFDIESGYTGEAREGIALLTMHPDWILVGFSFTNSTDWARYVPIAHDNGDNVDDKIRAAVALWSMLNTGLGVAHNLSFELKGLSRWFMEVLGDHPLLGAAVRADNGLFPYYSDSLIEAFLTGLYNSINPGQDLKSLTKHIFGHQMTKFEELFPELKGRTKRARFNSLELTDQVVNYACEDSVWCLALHKKHRPLMEGEVNLIYRTEMALVVVLVRMEQEGIEIDWPLVNKKDDEIHVFAEKYNEQIQANLSERLNETININLGSPKQLAEVLFEKLGLPIKERSEKTNEPSTSEKALGLIAKSDKVVNEILTWRTMVKLYGSYLDKYRRELTYGPRAYPNHKQTGAATGRMSVSDLPYQQWPKPYHYELGDGSVFDLNFRDLAISPDGFRIIGFDYSQVELRVLAGNAEEDALLQAFADGIDIHKATASNMMNIPLEQVTKKVRGRGKTLNFAVVYGSGPENIADMLTTPDDPVTKEDAIGLLEKYFAAFPKLKWWMDNKVVEGRANGYVTTMFGRRFTIWEYLDSRNWIRSKGDRMCVNAPIQGGAADYMKIAMVRASKAIRAAGLQDKIRLVMTIHDALEFYVHESISTQEVLDLLGPEVSYRVKGLPEIQADWHEGRTWGSVVEIKRDKAGQITGYGIEDVDEVFQSIEDAYTYQDNAKASKGAQQAAPEPVEVIEEEPRKAIVTISAMPDENQWFLFSEFIKKHQVDGPGMTFVTPEGSAEFAGILLRKEDQPNISALLGGASLTFEESMDLDSLLEGLTL